jgi:5-methylcytosine-specific restriction endonuclease McrA
VSQTKRKAIPQSVKLMLYGRANGRCAFPNCKRDVIVDATKADPTKQIGKIAHIVAHSDTGPRADPGYPKKKRYTYENLILFCSSCHDIVDAQPNTYTVEKLKAIKSEHENWIRSSLATEMPNVGFPELEIVAKAIASPPDKPTEDLSITAPQEKMYRNNLSNQISHLVHIGMTRSREVSDYIQHLSMIDVDFPERLKAGFVTAYKKFQGEKLVNDALFEAMHDFASGGSNNFKRQAAGLAVLVYLFESCEVFER